MPTLILSPDYRLVLQCECRLSRLTIGSSDRGSRVSDEPRRKSMIKIKHLRLLAMQPRVAQPGIAEQSHQT